MAVSVNVSNISNWTSAYYDRGKYMHKISNPTPGVYMLKRSNTAKYRVAKKTTGPYATLALAMAAADADMQVVRPTGVAPTTTTAGFTQPAVNATVVVPFTATTGYVVGMSVNIATAGNYQITNIAALNVTLLNLGGSNAPPTSAIATAKAVNAVAGPG